MELQPGERTHLVCEPWIAQKPQLEEHHLRNAGQWEAEQGSWRSGSHLGEGTWGGPRAGLPWGNPVAAHQEREQETWSESRVYQVERLAGWSSRVQGRSGVTLALRKPASTSMVFSRLSQGVMYVVLVNCHILFQLTEKLTLKVVCVSTHFRLKHVCLNFPQGVSFLGMIPLTLLQ